MRQRSADIKCRLTCGWWTSLLWWLAVGFSFFSVFMCVLMHKVDMYCIAMLLYVHVFLTSESCAYLFKKCFIVTFLIIIIIFTHGVNPGNFAWVAGTCKTSQHSSPGLILATLMSDDQPRSWKFRRLDWFWIVLTCWETFFSSPSSLYTLTLKCQLSWLASLTSSNLPDNGCNGAKGAFGFHCHSIVMQAWKQAGSLVLWDLL